MKAMQFLRSSSISTVMASNSRRSPRARRNTTSTAAVSGAISPGSVRATASSPSMRTATDASRRRTRFLSSATRRERKPTWRGPRGLRHQRQRQARRGRCGVEEIRHLDRSKRRWKGDDGELLSLDDLGIASIDLVRRQASRSRRRDIVRNDDLHVEGRAQGDSGRRRLLGGQRVALAGRDDRRYDGGICWCWRSSLAGLSAPACSRRPSIRAKARSLMRNSAGR